MPSQKKKISAFRGVYSQKCKRKSCIQDADSIPNPAYQMQTAYQSLHPTYRDSAYQVQTAYQDLHSAYQQFEIKNSGARKEPAAIPPNENASIVKATGERVNRKRSTGRAKPVLDPRGYSGTCGAPGRCKT